MSGADVAPLRSGDPGRLGEYEIAGVLGEGGQGVVYLGVDPSGRRAAVKWLRPDLAADAEMVERFLREVATAKRVAPFCTAQVIDVGVEAQRPYIVTEYIEGPSLLKRVRASGPLSGAALHRLAVGTATALAAIHRAGIVHRDLKPANVIMGPDGPRVIDFGIAKALDASHTLTSRPVGTPSYMSPEQVMGEPVGPPADLFAWACTIVHAATGRSPYGNDSLPAVINRILNGRHDLGDLEPPLRDTALACLARDPAARPTAEQVLLGLLRHTPGEQSPAAPPGQPPGKPWHHPDAGRAATQPGGRGAPAGRRGRGTAAAVASGALATAVIVAVGVLVATRDDNRTAAATDGVRPSPHASSASAAVSSTPVPLTATRLPGVDATIYESPSDPVRLTYYEVEDASKDQWINYPRSARTGAFSKNVKYWQQSISPDGAVSAGRTRKYTSDDFHGLDLIDRATGEVRTVKTVKYPLTYEYGEWTKDSRRLLLSVRNPGESGTWRTKGFLIVDVPTGKVTVRRINDPAIQYGRFYWAAGERSVAVAYQEGRTTGVRYYDLSGRPERTLNGVGAPYDAPSGLFSPSGASLVTRCADDTTRPCLWNAATGAPTGRPAAGCTTVLGWWDESHLFCWTEVADGGSTVSVVDLGGRRVRTLLETSEPARLAPFYSRGTA